MIQTGKTPQELNAEYQVNMLKHLEIEITEVCSEYLCGRMPVNEKTRQPIGILHGGASAVFAETLSNIGANLCVDEKRYQCVGLSIHTSHLKTISKGYLYGKAKFVHLGRSTHVWEINITDENKRLISVSRLTVAVLKKTNERQSFSKYPKN